MSPRKRFAIAVTVLVAALVLFSGYMAAGKRPPKSPKSEFAQAVDLTVLENVAVHRDGRLKSFASLSHEIMGFVLGPRRFRDQSPAFTYLDMMFRPEIYQTADVIFVKNKSLRNDIRDAFEGSAQYMHEPARYRQRMEDLSKWGLVSDEILADARVEARLASLQTDLMRSAKFVQAIHGAQATKFPANLRHNLRLMPPTLAGTGFYDAWSSLPSAHGGADSELAGDLDEAWTQLESSWRNEDAGGVNAAAGTLAELLPLVRPDLYPSTERLSWESWYFRSNNLTWIWMVYLLAVILLLLSLVHSWRPAAWAGLSVFGIAFALQTAALGLRWWISGRWPNSNMFEAVTTAAWFGGCAAVILEIVGRRTSMAKLFALTSSVGSMVALMSAAFLPLHLNPNIGNMMPVLHDLWLYIHTNVIIWSYMLIFMAAVSGMLYLVHRACGAQRESLKMAGTSFAMATEAEGTTGGGSSGGTATMGDGTAEGGGTGLGPVLDGVTMALMKLSFIMLWAGLVMGAIWADHSWGRPWGWDPKETFALCTFIIFALLVHVRWKARDKGLWTAALAVTGAGVMLFNWIVINFYIQGLHSYA